MLDIQTHGTSADERGLTVVAGLGAAESSPLFSGTRGTGIGTPCKKAQGIVRTSLISGPKLIG